MTARKLHPREQCDWCRGRLGPEVYTLLLPSGMQIVVGSCCARPAAESASRSPTPKVAARGREVLHLLEEQ